MYFLDEEWKPEPVNHDLLVFSTPGFILNKTRGKKPLMMGIEVPTQEKHFVGQSIYHPERRGPTQLNPKAYHPECRSPAQPNPKHLGHQ